MSGRTEQLIVYQPSELSRYGGNRETNEGSGDLGPIGYIH